MPSAMIEERKVIEADLHATKKMFVKDGLVTQLWFILCVHQRMYFIAPIRVFITFSGEKDP